MNILFLAERYLPHAGGARVYYASLYERLAREHGDRVSIVTKEVPGWRDFDALQESEAYAIFRKYKPLAAWKYHQIDKLLCPLFHARSVMSRVKPEVLHVGDLHPQGVIALLLKTFYGLPYLAYCHGEEITQTDQTRFEPLLRNAIYNGADAVIAANSFAAANLRRIGVPAEKIETITPGLDFDRVSPGPPDPDIVKRYALEGRRVLLTVGRLIPRKGHLTVMESLSTLAARFPDVRYLIVGVGPEEERLRNAARELGVDHLTIFTGEVPTRELAGFYRTCDIFVMPNFEESQTGDVEGFGMVFLEANAAGKPAVGGRSGGTAEAILDGVTGRLCEPRNPQSLASILAALLDDEPLRRRLGEQGLARVREQFHWSDRANQLRRVSQMLVSARACSGVRSGVTS